MSTWSDKREVFDASDTRRNGKKVEDASRTMRNWIKKHKHKYSYTRGAALDGG